MGVAKPSKAMPFLTAPACQSVDMVGNAGFDPLYFSDFLDIKWLREAELKHGRICMLCAAAATARDAMCSENAGAWCGMGGRARRVFARRRAGSQEVPGRRQP